MNNPQTVEEIVRGFENDFRDYLDASILHYEVSGRPLSSEDEIEWLTKKANEIISNDRLTHKTALLEAIGNYDTKEHICGFNDGDCDCECFLAALDTIKDLINTWA